MVVAGSNGPSGRQMSTWGGKRDVEWGMDTKEGREQKGKSGSSVTGLMGARVTEREG